MFVPGIIYVPGRLVPHAMVRPGLASRPSRGATDRGTPQGRKRAAGIT